MSQYVQCDNRMNAEEESPWMAFGLIFHLDNYRRLREILAEIEVGVIAEGTTTSGYELYIGQSDLASLELLKADPRLGDLKIQFYERPRNMSDGSRYDRLVDHLVGPDPSRPPLRGISFEPDGMRGIVGEP